MPVTRALGAVALVAAAAAPAAAQDEPGADRFFFVDKESKSERQATTYDGSLTSILSPQRGQIRYAGSGWRRRPINRRSVAPGEVICHHAVHVI